MDNDVRLEAMVHEALVKYSLVILDITTHEIILVRLIFKLVQ